MPKEILIVDDQPGIRLLLTDILASEGYEISLANNGKAALEKIHQHLYDLIILDYKLPIIDGIEVLKILEREKSEIPVILMSGMAENILTETEKLQMVKKVVSKPFNVKDFCMHVSRVLA